MAFVSRNETTTTVETGLCIQNSKKSRADTDGRFLNGVLLHDLFLDHAAFLFMLYNMCMVSVVQLIL